MSPRRILISGGLGFIGLDLAKALRNTHEVTVIDNLSSARAEALSGVAVHVGEVAAVLKSLNPSDYDLFYHFGEYARVEQSLGEFKTCMASNFGPVAGVLEFCRQGQIKLVYSGSSTKFTTGAVGSHLSPYTWSKAINTDLVERYAEWYGLEYAICYFYNVFGPGEISTGQYATVIAKFIEAKKRGQSVEITRPGTQLRNFTHIEDTVRALIAIGDRGTGDGHCIANAQAHTILEVAEMLELPYALGPENPANRLAASYDLSKMQALGWAADISLKSYLAEV